MITVSDIAHHFPNQYQNYQILRLKSGELLTSADGSLVDEHGIPVEYWNYYKYKNRHVVKLEVESNTLKIYIE